MAYDIFIWLIDKNSVLMSVVRSHLLISQGKTFARSTLTLSIHITSSCRIHVFAFYTCISIKYLERIILRLESIFFILKIMRFFFCIAKENSDSNPVVFVRSTLNFHCALNEHNHYKYLV